jgi:hypothetical protein
MALLPPVVATPLGGVLEQPAGPPIAGPRTRLRVILRSNWLMALVLDALGNLPHTQRFRPLMGQARLPILVEILISCQDFLRHWRSKSTLQYHAGRSGPVYICIEQRYTGQAIDVHQSNVAWRLQYESHALDA